MYWKYYAAGGKHLICIYQGWKDYVGKSNAIYVALLWGYFGGTSFGNLCAVCIHGITDVGGNGIKTILKDDKMLQ